MNKIINQSYVTVAVAGVEFMLVGIGRVVLKNKSLKFVTFAEGLES